MIINLELINREEASLGDYYRKKDSAWRRIINKKFFSLDEYYDDCEFATEKEVIDNIIPMADDFQAQVLGE